jgi:hypothetical protein
MIVAPTIDEVRAVDRRVALVFDQACRSDRRRLLDVERRMPWATPAEVLHALPFDLGLGLGIGQSIDACLIEWTPNLILSQLGWWFDADKGLTLLGAQNLQRQSETLSTTPWAGTNTGAITADGGMWRIPDNATASIHFISGGSMTGLIASGAQHRFSIDVAAGTCTRALIALNGAADYIDVNLTTGAVLATVGGSLSVISGPVNVGTHSSGATIWRYVIQDAHVAGTDVRIYVNDGGAVSYAGTGKYILATRAHVFTDFTAPYIVTTTAAAESVNNVTAWGDQSTNGRHGAQSVYTAQGVYQASDPLFVNRASILLDGASDFYDIGGSAGANDDDWIIAALVAPLQTASATQHAWYSNRGSDFDTVTGGEQGYSAVSAQTDVFLGYNSAANGTTIIPFAYLTGATPGPANNPAPAVANSVAHVHVLRAAGGSTRHYLDSTTPRAATTQTHRTRVTVGRLGWDESAAAFFKGAYREVLAVRGTLSDANVTNLIRYLGRKGGVPIAA